MKRKTISITLVFITLVVALAFANAPASAKPADTYTIDWYTMDGGGTMSAVGGPYMLSGTIGQPDAGTLNGGNYKLNGGFWGLLDSFSNLFLPLIMR